MRKNLMTLVFLLLSRATQRMNESRVIYKDMTHLKMKLLYLQTIKTCRWLFISFLGIGVCVAFLLSSLIVLNAALFFYTPWGLETKLFVGILLAVIYLLIALGVFYFIFSEKKWLNMFHADQMLKNVGPSHP